MNRRAFQKLAEMRLADARALLKPKRYDAAYYMAGYTVECALKACIAKRTKRHDFPAKDANSLYTHELEALLSHAGIKQAFDAERREDPALDREWMVVKDWNPNTIRYEIRRMGAAQSAKAIVGAIENRQHGVLQCLSKYW